QRQLGKTRPRFTAGDRVFLAALLHRLPREVLGRFRLLMRPETVLRWHGDLLARRHAVRSAPGAWVGRVPSARSACWSFAWHERILPGATAVSTANCSSWASGPLLPPCGRSSGRPGSTRYPGAAQPGAVPDPDRDGKFPALFDTVLR